MRGREAPTVTPVQSPCMGCAGRKIGCHAACEKYATYKIRLEEIREANTAQKALTSMSQRTLARKDRSKSDKWAWKRRN